MMMTMKTQSAVAAKAEYKGTGRGHYVRTSCAVFTADDTTERGVNNFAEDTIFVK